MKKRFYKDPSLKLGLQINQSCINKGRATMRSFFTKPQPHCAHTILFSSTQCSVVPCCTSAVMSSKLCCTWLEFQAQKISERGTWCCISPAGTAVWLSMADSCWPRTWTAAESTLAALPGHVWNGPAVMYWAAFNLIYAHLWKTSLQCVHS